MLLLGDNINDIDTIRHLPTGVTALKIGFANRCLYFLHKKIKKSKNTKHKKIAVETGVVFCWIQVQVMITFMIC